MKKYLKIILIIFVILLIFVVAITSIKTYNNNQKKEKKKNNETILFLGDSLTARYDLNKYYSSYYVVNSGINGNYTFDILDNMDSRVYKYKPKKIFLLIGINDLLFTKNSNESIINNIKEIVNKINDNTDSKIFLESIYPVNTNKAKDVDKKMNDRIIKINKKLNKFCFDNTCTYIDIYNELVDHNGNLKRIYTKDGIHLNRFGYLKVTNKLLKYI